MERLTDKRFCGDGFYQPKSREERKGIMAMIEPSYKTIYKRLGEYENEAEQRENGCEFCRGMKHLYGDFSGSGEQTETGVIRMSTEDAPDFNFCPMCGRKIEKEER